ncbi:MAG: hypothetical protein HLUCCA12_09775 [Rhodobacteraceae bacterium HLUCCA12]|nr:MAG: hypothetical protein HLUCCA12_09775 [Rhodobacteraceae bacterium HLUCCA12]
MIRPATARDAGAIAALDFVDVGLIRDGGWKFGRCHDPVLMQKRL